MTDQTGDRECHHECAQLVVTGREWFDGAVTWAIVTCNGCHKFWALKKRDAALEAKLTLLPEALAALEDCKDEGLVHHSECAKWEHPGTSWSLRDDIACDCYVARVTALIAKLQDGG